MRDLTQYRETAICLQNLALFILVCPTRTLAKRHPERLSGKTFGIVVVITVPEKGSMLANMVWALKSNEGHGVESHYKPPCGKNLPGTLRDNVVITT